MTNDELNELDRILNSAALEDEASHTVLEAVPRLIAKVRAANALAAATARIARTKDDSWHHEAREAPEAYQKAGDWVVL